MIAAITPAEDEDREDSVPFTAASRGRRGAAVLRTTAPR